ncbi:hypothetical protein [Mesorhizobium sp. ANAO-SY3R2]|uniref:hypothetical protein n=1 Tax=Mesorhizobium sp. ANAO-SY3R2 TaxID=3166644 RepID=UPI00366E0519
MSFSYHSAFSLLVCLSATLLGGCSRSSDGSVIIPKHMDSRRFWQDDEAKRAATERELAARYPEGGPQIRFVEQQAMSARRGPKSKSGGVGESRNSDPLACRSVASPTGRVRHYCD